MYYLQVITEKGATKKGVSVEEVTERNEFIAKSAPEEVVEESLSKEDKEEQFPGVFNQ